MNEICYFKKIVVTESKEGIAFLRRFDLDIERCQKYCLGYKGRGECGKFITQDEVDIGGLASLVRR